MKSVLRRTWVPLLAVTLVQLVINSRSVSISSMADALSKAVLFLGLYLATSFLGGAVHAAVLRRRPEAGLTTCILDGATIGLLSNLIAQVFSAAMHGSDLDLLISPSGDSDPVLWIWKIALFFVIVMIFGFISLLSGGLGGCLGGMVYQWMAHIPMIGGKHD